jgi:ATP-binding cassette subfamily C (CFTR/MRP) protein 1
MISLLFNRTMTLPDGVHTESAALTLMSTGIDPSYRFCCFTCLMSMLDIDNILEFLENINDIWARTLEIAVGTYLLARQLGATCVVPLILTLGTF